MADDPIVKEVREAREAHARRFDYDLDAIFRDLKEREKRSGRKYVRFPSRPAAPMAASRRASTE